MKLSFGRAVSIEGPIGAEPRQSLLPWDNGQGGGDIYEDAVEKGL